MKDIKISDQTLYAMAEKKTREIRSFYYNLLAYCIVIPTLIIINLTFNPEFYWFIFSMVGWGTGLLLHWMSAFGRNPLVGKGWEERKLAALIAKDRLRNRIIPQAPVIANEQQLNDHMRYERAKKQVTAIAGFFKHFTAYLLVNIFLLAIKYYQLKEGADYFTFATFQTAFFWGFGLAAHGVSVFGRNVFLSDDWEERKIRELMKKQSVSRWE
jgi:hypothetical protein